MLRSLYTNHKQLLNPFITCIASRMMITVPCSSSWELSAQLVHESQLLCPFVTCIACCCALHAVVHCILLCIACCCAHTPFDYTQLSVPPLLLCRGKE